MDNLASEFVEAHGLPYERLADLEIGMGLRGSMKDRLAIPILNSDEELVAYCGRDVGLLAGDEPKYKFPDNFDKDLELYGWHVAQHFDRVVLVESFLSVIKHGGAASKFGDNGFGVAALMGTTISKSQIELLKQVRPKIIVCMDGDEAGMTASPIVAGQIAKAGLWVNVYGYDGGKKPYDDDIETFCQLYGKI
jgi:DNA primase